jgi:hypothetical protein
LHPCRRKRIAILGSTGSIGTQALDVVREQPEHFEVELLTCGNNVDLLIEQALEFKPNAVVIGDPAKLDAVKDALFPLGIKVYAGADAWSRRDHGGHRPGADRAGGLRRAAAHAWRPSMQASTSPWPTRRPWWWPGELVTKAARTRG